LPTELKSFYRRRKQGLKFCNAIADRAAVKILKRCWRQLLYKEQDGDFQA
jgi:hypothetical protein